MEKIYVTREFMKDVMKDILNPEIHKTGQPSEVCGSFMVESDGMRKFLKHDSKSVGRRVNQRGFQMGGLEDGVQFCQPKKSITNILWHTHPKGVPCYPSGSDVYITLIKDCGSFSGETAQALVEFLFTEVGFWLIMRRVEDDKPVPAIDISNMYEEIDGFISILEKHILREYYKTPVPNQSIAETIQGHPHISNKACIQFHPWSDDDICVEIPGVLLTTPMSQVSVCSR